MSLSLQALNVVPAALVAAGPTVSTFTVCDFTPDTVVQLPTASTAFTLITFVPSGNVAIIYSPLFYPDGNGPSVL